MSATFLIVCLNAQIMLSNTSLNWAGGMLTKAGKQWLLTAWSNRKKFVLCSGYSSKSLLIIAGVHSNTASKIFGTSDVIRLSNLLTIIPIAERTSGSRTEGMAVLW